VAYLFQDRRPPAVFDDIMQECRDRLILVASCFQN
jgi:hypothetical protein